MEWNRNASYFSEAKIPELNCLRLLNMQSKVISGFEAENTMTI